MRTLILFLICSITLFAQDSFENKFYDKALRLDFFHTGDATSEVITLDELISEEFYAGSKNNLIDTLKWGNYRFEIISLKSNKIIFSKGFSTLFQEWQTTSESKVTQKTFSGSIRFPSPKDSCKVIIYRRNWEGKFEPKFNLVIDPKDYFIRPEKNIVLNNFKVHYSGDYHKKLDILFIPEGYTKEEMDKFKDDCKVYAGYLFDYEPFKSFENDINIWGVEAISKESGADIPADSVWVNTILNSKYYTFDSERYLMTTDYKRVMDVAANAPYDQIYILVNSNKYGGGAIYNFYSLGITGNKTSKQVFVHEFGHGLAGLADEYVDPTTYNNYYNLNIEPWEPNITTLKDFSKKWKHLVPENIPIPTPANSKYENVNGAFEGGGYVAKGVYRSTKESIMKAFNSNEFNDVSKEALIKIIKFYSK